jgi:hypothetical protein
MMGLEDRLIQQDGSILIPSITIFVISQSAFCLVLLFTCTDCLWLFQDDDRKEKRVLFSLIMVYRNLHFSYSSS